MADENNNLDYYKDKIRKLLSLAQSPVQAEAQNAMLKARKLMAKYKLDEKDLQSGQSKEVEQILTAWSYTTLTDPWMPVLANVIGKNHCCQAFSQVEKGKKKRQVGFYGFHDDVVLCIEIYNYAAQCIMGYNKQLRKMMEGYSGSVIRNHCNSYGYGFASGVQKAYRQQNQENQEVGIALVIPREVQDATASLKNSKPLPPPQNKKSFLAGFEDGKNFDPSDKLATGYALNSGS